MLRFFPSERVIGFTNGDVCPFPDKPEQNVRERIDIVMDDFSRFPFVYGGEEEGAEATFEEFDATQLYCPRCREAVPVKKRLLLVLPEGEKYEYLCAYCFESVGTKMK